MSGQHCENYDVKRETVHCYPGNSSLLPAKCWPLLHVTARISARFSNLAFVSFCYITNHLMTGPLGNSEFCFPRISMFPSTSRRETLKFSGNKIPCSPRDQSLSAKCSIPVLNSVNAITHPYLKLSSSVLAWRKVPILRYFAYFMFLS